MTEAVQIVLLGVRGSIPVCDKRFARYGGATTCVLVRMGGKTIVLDAGTGMNSLGERLQSEEEQIHLFLTHPHVDHLLGLPACPLLLGGNHKITVSAVAKGGRNAKEQLGALMSAPLWPAEPELFTDALEFKDLCAAESTLGVVTIRCFPVKHPGGCTAFRLECAGKSVVFATDCELSDTVDSSLCAFAKDCTLLLCDAQYTDEEYNDRRGFGHSSISAALRLAKSSGASQVRFIHHDPCRTDEELERMQLWLTQQMSNASFGRCGEEIWI